MTTRAARAHRELPRLRPTLAGRDGVTRGSEVVALACALTLTAATIEISVSGHLRVFFDLCFVGICVMAALMVRAHDFFTVGVLPPLLMSGTMLLVALNGTRVIGSRHDSVVQAVVTGLAHHSLALFIGYAACLVVLALRRPGGRRTTG